LSKTYVKKNVQREFRLNYSKSNKIFIFRELYSIKIFEIIKKSRVFYSRVIKIIKINQESNAEERNLTN